VSMFGYCLWTGKYVNLPRLMYASHTHLVCFRDIYTSCTQSMLNVVRGGRSAGRLLIKPTQSIPPQFTHHSLLVMIVN
jgi:hypothetical protein